MCVASQPCFDVMRLAIEPDDDASAPSRHAAAVDKKKAPDPRIRSFVRSSPLMTSRDPSRNLHAPSLPASGDRRMVRGFSGKSQVDPKDLGI
jgi:hypothetical protein